MANTPDEPDLSPDSPPAKSSRSWLVGILGGVLTLVLVIGGLVVLSLGQFAASLTAGLESGESYEELVTRPGTANRKIAVIRVFGMINSYSIDGSGKSMVQRIRDKLDLAGEDPAVRAVLIRIDSPGGEVMASDEIHQSLVQFQKDYPEKPVICSMAGLAASGGYYIAAACPTIVAHELTLTGSIGVIFQTVNVRGLLDKVGLEPMTFKSGAFKDMMDSFKPPADITPAEKAMIQKIVDRTYDRFLDIVESGRARAAKLNDSHARALAEDWKDHADGRVLTGGEAHDLGFVDQLGNFQDAVALAEKLAKISPGKARLIRYQAPVNLTGILRLFGKTPSKPAEQSLKLDLGLPTPRLEPGRPYYLSPLTYR